MTKLEVFPDPNKEKTLRLYSKDGEYHIYASGGGIDAEVWAGSYKNGRLIDVKKRSVDKNNPLIHSSVGAFGLDIAGADEVRAFMLDKLLMMKPLLPAEKINIK